MNRIVTFFATMVTLSCLLPACKTTSSTVTLSPSKSTALHDSEPAPVDQAQLLDHDTPKTTAEGNTFVAPAGWSISSHGAATILYPPEKGSAIALIDLHAPSAKQAVAAAWRIYKPDAKWPLLLITQKPDKDGWTNRSTFSYQTSPNEKRAVAATVQHTGDIWTVAIYDMAIAVGEKRLAQVALIFDQLFPKGYKGESFKGKKAHKLDKARIAELGEFIKKAMKQTKVPGVALGLVQDGKVIFADGFGVRSLGSEDKVDAETLFMIASNTKALTTLMLAKLVDDKKLTWDAHVTSLLPSFKLGDPSTTSQVEVRHLICACTGLPRQDMEWLFQFEGLTPEKALATLGTMQPTSKFGEIFQYSNPLAGAGGFVGGHILFPKLELGKAYDKAMQTLVLDPLHMKSTTFDYASALNSNHAMPHSVDIDGKLAHALMEINYAVIPLRPAGGAWSNVRDLLSYVSMELADGVLPDGKRYISKEPLLERRATQVTIGKYTTYGMGLMVNNKYGVSVVHHGGDLIGYHSDMMWLPDYGVGAVILTNGDPGWLIRTLFRRKLLEVLFDGRPEADKQLAAGAKSFFERMASERKLITIPADKTEAGKLAKHYTNQALGDIEVRQDKGKTIFDFGEWSSEMATQKNPDGTVSFITTTPGVNGFDFLMINGKKRTLILRDAQHEYIFTEK